MTIILFLYILLLTAITLKVYRRLYSVITAVGFMFSVTTVFLIIGITAFNGTDYIAVSHTRLGKGMFYILIIIWYATDILCSSIIIKRYIRYRRINREYFMSKKD